MAQTIGSFTLNTQRILAVGVDKSRVDIATTVSTRSNLLVAQQLTNALKLQIHNQVNCVANVTALRNTHANINSTTTFVPISVLRIKHLYSNVTPSSNVQSNLQYVLVIKNNINPTATVFPKLGLTGVANTSIQNQSAQYVYANIDKKINCVINTESITTPVNTVRIRKADCYVNPEVRIQSTAVRLPGVKLNLNATSVVDVEPSMFAAGTSLIPVEHSTKNTSTFYWKQNTPALRIGKYILLDEAIGRIKIPFDPYL